ncbi:MAG TPA: V-type ATP synthase subunit E [Geopsychrobacteraceae bacterium]|nr:V-type ATP synthase subunit E [Geopsychrobacteraceae bacterium]
MGQQELEAALRREGEERAREIWCSVEASAHQLRDETDEKLQALRQKSRWRQGAEVARLVEEARSAAFYRGRMCRLTVEQGLDRRLQALVASLTSQLAESGGEDLFAALAAEIPEFNWTLVKVNPRDEGVARACFEAAEIVTDESIGGGLSVQGDDGRLIVTNTLEKRMSRLWPELLPEMMKELRQRIENDGTAAPHSTK